MLRSSGPCLWRPELPAALSSWCHAIAYAHTAGEAASVKVLMFQDLNVQLEASARGIPGQERDFV